MRNSGTNEKLISWIISRRSSIRQIILEQCHIELLEEIPAKLLERFVLQLMVQFPEKGSSHVKLEQTAPTYRTSSGPFQSATQTNFQTRLPYQSTLPKTLPDSQQMSSRSALALAEPPSVSVGSLKRSRSRTPWKMSVEHLEDVLEELLERFSNGLMEEFSKQLKEVIL